MREASAARKVLPRLMMSVKYVNMTDLTTSSGRLGTLPGAKQETDLAPVGLANERLIAMVELLFFAYRDFIAEPDAVLAEIGFGRAHHRVLHFVNRNPGLRVADLLGVLRITKQSLARVLKQLVDDGYVQHNPGETDRRERRLHLTSKGRELAERLLALQTCRMSQALGAAGAATGPAAERFLTAVVSAANRSDVQRLIEGGTGKGRSSNGDRS